jgi:hypothetical protein
MDHETAVKLQATEKYVLGELTGVERDEFEEHLADCSRCMEDVQAADIFAANTRAVFQDRAATAAAPARRGRWLDLLLLRPVPALALSGALNFIFAGLLVYGAVQVVPSLKSRLSDYETPHAVASFAVRGVSRGAGDVFTADRSTPNVVLRFDLPQRYAKYSYTIEGAAGQTRRSGELRVSVATDVLNLTIPIASLEPGVYNVKVTGSDGAQSEEIGHCVLRIRPNN